MRILLRNGRVLQGSPTDIVAAMRAKANAVHLSIDDYVARVARDFLVFEGVDLGSAVHEGNDRPRRLLHGMLQHGFAIEERLNVS